MDVTGLNLAPAKCCLTCGQRDFGSTRHATSTVECGKHECYVWSYAVCEDWQAQTVKREQARFTAQAKRISQPTHQWWRPGNVRHEVLPG